MSVPSEPAAPPEWTRTQEFLRQRFQIEQDSPEELGLTFVTRLVPDRPEAQQVLCGLEVQNGQPWLLARADVCREPFLDAPDALRLAARLRIGGLALVDGVYEVRRAFRLAELDHAALAEALQYLALEAAFLRTRARPLPGQPEPTPPAPGAAGEASSADAPEPEPDAEPAAIPAPARHWTD